jgi:transcription elongation factor Elf1
MKSTKTIGVSLCCNNEVRLVKEDGVRYWRCQKCGHLCETKTHTTTEEVDTSNHDKWLKENYPTGPSWTGD